MKRLKKDKVKRGRIILSAILTFAVALLSLGFGCYMGYITLDINYLTIGTMTYAVGGLLVIAGFFIFFGCVGGVIALKEIFISSRNEEKFSAYKGALISAIVYYCIIALICIIGIIVAVASYVPSNHTWIVVALSALTLVLCAAAFYCVFRELREHKKKTRNKNNQNSIANMDLNAGEIRKFSDAQLVNNSNVNNQNNPQNNGQNNSSPTSNSQSQNNFSQNQGSNNSDNGRISSENNQKEVESRKEDIKSILSTPQEKADLDLYSIAEKLMQLEELRKAGLISDQEYFSLKNKIL